MGLAACGVRPAKIMLYSQLGRFSQPFSTLLSTISSPDFHAAQLSFLPGVSADDPAQELLYLEESKYL